MMDESLMFVNDHSGTYVELVEDSITYVFRKYNINDTLIQKVNILIDYEIVVVCDDSSSMNDNWNEAKNIISIIIDLYTAVSKRGIDIHFLNRASFFSVTDSKQLDNTFQINPIGSSLMISTIKEVSELSNKLIIFITNGKGFNGNTTGTLNTLISASNSRFIIMLCSEHRINHRIHCPNLEIIPKYKEMAIGNDIGTSSLGDHVVTSICENKMNYANCCCIIV